MKVSQNPLFFGMFANQICCTGFNKDRNVSMYNSNKCKYEHKHITDSQLYEYKKYTINDKMYKVPINLVGKTNNNVFQYNSNMESLYLIKEGFYRITYNLCYHGSVYDVRTMISIEDRDLDSDPEIITFSINKSINRLDNTIKDKYYDTIKNDDHLEEITQYVNHSFVYQVKSNRRNNTRYQLSLKLRFLNKNKHKNIYIHPINTWLNIEQINASQD